MLSDESADQILEIFGDVGEIILVRYCVNYAMVAIFSAEIQWLNIIYLTIK